MSMSHICRATCKTPKNLDVVGIRQCSAFALHLACIRSRCSAVADQKKRSFSTMASFFFIIGNGFQRFVGQTFITSISFKYTVCGKKGRKKISSPGERNSPPRISSPGYGPAPEERSFSINVRELWAIRLGLLQFQHLIEGLMVGIFADNTMALAYVRKRGGGGGGGISKPLNSEAQVLLRWSESLNVTLLPQFVMGSHNVIADSLSHKNQVIGSKWTLVQEVTMSYNERGASKTC